MPADDALDPGVLGDDGGEGLAIGATDAIHMRDTASEGRMVEHDERRARRLLGQLPIEPAQLLRPEVAPRRIGYGAVERQDPKVAHLGRRR